MSYNTAQWKSERSERGHGVCVCVGACVRAVWCACVNMYPCIIRQLLVLIITVFVLYFTLYMTDVVTITLSIC